MDNVIQSVQRTFALECCGNRPTKGKAANYILEFITDVEGNWKYFLEFVSRSKVLYFEGPDLGVWGPGTLALADDGILVFGGDSQDKGPGDIRFGKAILALKRRYPDRVHLVIGNRDINKLRFAAELAAGEDGGNVDVYWAPKSKPYDEYLVETGQAEGLVSTCQWMLKENMGSATTWATRQQELLEISGKQPTDEEVVESFRSSVDPKGADPWLLELMKVMEIIVVVEDKMFVHGGMSPASIGVVPGKSSVALNVKDWAEQMNAWAAAELKDFDHRPLWYYPPGASDPKQRSRGAAELIKYGTPASEVSVIYHNPFVNGNAVVLPSAVENFLLASGISRVFTGHQPHGQSPSIVRQPESGILCLACDTSYSDMKAPKDNNPADNRGKAVTVVRAEGDKVHLEGVVADGSSHHFTLHCDPVKDEYPFALVGRQLQDGSWVKSLTEVDGKVGVRAVLGEGFKLTPKVLPASEATAQLKSEHALPEGMKRGDDPACFKAFLQDADNYK
eukprot:gnl/TRDRNA2_/TRDRNA2_177002_c1_seq1.p1 gnl/TRDRNA2_/TRDRNA2_177002_c1~~gnl/TRDRNA2_/TRDRNA2_177002_c1_seq1.p1  ORF type:complete len:537 (+),score=101.95 gnl/TRDRNA2_/TRDRNA2_177002_c1_seq1:94-1611(+)